jgi:ubiquinone/menaquinone biosynthesis C-methylase UbiE
MQSNNLSWDYTSLAQYYIYRPPYSQKAIDWMIATTCIQIGDHCCDIGSGTGALAVDLLSRGLQVDAIEPNSSMRAIGENNTQTFSKIAWFYGTGEETGRPESYYSLVTYGSSFNTTNRPRALVETARILKPNSWFACLWNHRDSTDPMQEEIDAIINFHIPGYNSGTRREDQSQTIQKSGAFYDVKFKEEQVLHTVSTKNWLQAWRAHATLIQQAGASFDSILSEIEILVTRHSSDFIRVPYFTRVWAAQVRKD